MAALVQCVDEVIGADPAPKPAFQLRLVSHRMTVAELIRRRVEHEVGEYNRQPDRVFQGLVQPTDAERALNGVRPRQRRQIDAEQQVQVALDAFEANRFFLLFDDRQVESLDTMLTVTETSVARFVRLVPLVGG